MDWKTGLNKELFITIFGYEFRRSRLMIFLMIMVLLVTGLILTGGESHIELSYESYGDQGPPQSHPKRMLEIYVISVVGLMGLPAFLLGLIVAVILPWRRRSDWEQGRFELWSLSPVHPFWWEVFRLLSYLILLVLYYCCLFILIYHEISQRLGGDQEMIGRLMVLIIMISLTVLPFLLGLSSLLAAIRAAYRSQDRRYTISIMLAISWLVLVSRGLEFLKEQAANSQGKLFKPLSLELESGQTLISQDFIYIHPDWLLLSIISSIGMVLIAARVYTEIEVA